jgi:hypothetical protein
MYRADDRCIEHLLEREQHWESDIPVIGREAWKRVLPLMPTLDVGHPSVERKLQTRQEHYTPIGDP